MTQVIAPFNSPAFRAARILDEPKAGPKPTRDLTAEEKKRARHMAHEGASLSEIQAALGFDCCVAIFRRKLKALNIRWGRKNKCAHRGDMPSLPKRQLSKGGLINIRSYRPCSR